MSSYIINKTNGSVLTELIDGTINQTASDLTLIGKNSSSYGEFFNENLIHLLENFANTSQPNYPIQGQLWFDTSEGRLKVYDGNGFKVSGGTIVSASVPGSIAQGDVWIDSARQQMYFNDGVATLLAGPIYTQQQGVSGFQAIDIIDTNTISHTILLLYIGGTPIGVFSKEEFTPGETSQIPNFSGTVKVGFNVGNTSGFKINAPVTQADTLLAADLSLKTADDFVSSTNNSAMQGRLSISNETPLTLGLNQNFEVHVDLTSMQFISNRANQNVSFDLLNTSLKTAMFMDAQNERIGIYNTDPQAMLDVAGDAIIQGDLTVLGNVTTVNSTNLEIQDKLIDLGVTGTPTNSTANGGGISLAAGVDTDKTLTWELATHAWTSSENFDLFAGKGYYVNGFPVINQTAIGTTVTSAPGITSLGTLTTLTVDNISINDNVISYINPSIGNGDIVLLPKGIGSVNVSNKAIINVASPTNGTDATNKTYVDNSVSSAPLGLSINVGTYTNTEIATIILNRVYPPEQHLSATVCRIWCIDLAIAKEFTVSAGAWIWTADL